MSLGPCLEHQPMHSFGKGWVCARCGTPVAPKPLVTAEWVTRKSALEGDSDPTTGLPMTQDYTALVAELRQRARLRSSERFPPSTFVEGRAADAIASLERQLAEVRGERDFEAHVNKMLLSWAAENGCEPDLLLTEWIGERNRATTAEAERDRLAARCEGLERALTFYADKERWRDFQSDEMAAAFDRNFGTELGSDLGAIARAALQEPQP